MTSQGHYLPFSDSDPGLATEGLEYPGSFFAGTTLQPSIGPSDDQDSRRHLRNPVEACRPIAVQVLDDLGQPASAWYLADILDVSVGGFCLLITEDQPMPLAQRLRIRLDVRPHPSFGVDVMPAVLRWFVRSGFVVTLGVGFEKPLDSLPLLLPCRRSTKRQITA
ncbi:PilZ domain-containing protein [Synechococcus sp. CCY9201]|uniref:PilZ domain-containing protein n=1 Tax=unclassified Synechococcus TaxID=2626047 RepID=UPI0018CD8276|nr:MULTISPECIES: PilZ domain-containing protein [unclassified Synechococcus]MEA5474596.1 PilZ domain-containing protein [Synechococcus sp. CCY9201]QPN60602.1 PilZ domain-containing protein [Synechococcus sp. CBW1002]QPN67696.1 PilZ domain-containing protein [Synechococcus sp. CBW1006]